MGDFETQFKGRGRGVSSDTPSKMCICTRPDNRVLCRVCGFIVKGRLRKKCMSHPLTLFLMDLESCPRCKAHSFMMEEFTS